MSISGVNNHYSNYMNYDTVDKSKETKTEVKREEEKQINADAYLSELKKKHPTLNLKAGSVNTNIRKGNYPKQLDVMIAPDILAQMASDPEAAKKYGDMLSGLPAAVKWGDTAIKGMTGSTVLYRQVWIDKDGNMGSFSMSGPSKEQQRMDVERKKQEQESFQELLEGRREKKKELEELFMTKNVDLKI